MEHSKTKKTKYPRINLAFYGDNLEFCREMAWKNHQSVTAYVNDLITAEMSKHEKAEWKSAAADETK